MDVTKIGQIAAVVSVLTATNPLEIIKLRLQTAQELWTTGRIKQNYSSIRHCISSMAQKEGIRSFWKGNTIGIARFFPNEYINYKMRGMLQNLSSNTISMNLAVAVVAGWTASSFLYPVDILRQSLGTNTEKGGRLIATFKELLKTNGPKYFYKGFLNSMVGIAIFRASFNGIYDSAKQNAHTINQKAVVAYFCATIAGVICHPLDIVRRRRILLNSNENYFSFASRIWRNEGFRGFYKGSNIIPLQSIAGAIILLMFDTAGIKKGEEQSQ